MAMLRLFTADLGPLRHSPTWMLIIGTFVFWLELLVVRLSGGHCSWLAWGLWLICAGYIFFKSVPFSLPKMSKLMCAFLALAFIYLGIAFYAALFPPHLVQEFDVINYHVMVPRQHLILHDFFHISWSVADLFLLPLDYALSPFWLATTLPNKFPQFIFLVAILVLVYKIVHKLTQQDDTKAMVASVAVMALHMVAIQAGTAMMDMIMVYCVLACLDSLINGRFVLAGIEGAFFFWSKSFIPPMMIIVVGVLLLIIWVFKRCRFSLDVLYRDVLPHITKFAGCFLVATLIIAAPPVIKSVYYTGTSLYPFGINQAWASVNYDDHQWAMIAQRTQDSLNMKEAYGHGRGWTDFLKHFWLIAVPEKGVNNAFDYPVGLIYLLVLGPFVVSIMDAIRSRRVPVLSIFIVLWWGAWWMGSQQTRFLLIPICLMIVVAIIHMKTLSRFFIALVIATMILEIFSLVNAHRPDWGKNALSVLREKDRELIRMGQSNGASKTVLDYPDVAFASFAVTVQNNKESIFVFPQ